MYRITNMADYNQVSVIIRIVFSTASVVEIINSTNDTLTTSMSVL